MKKFFLILTIILTYSTSFSQILSSEKFENYSIRSSNKSLDSLNENDNLPKIGVPTSIFLLSPNIPINFSRLEKLDNGNYRVGASLSIGSGYAFMIGKGTRLEGNSINVDPQFIVGVAGNVGVVQNEDNNNIEASLTLGMIIGFGKFSAFLGKDFLTNSTILGLGARIDAFSITEAGTTILHFK